MRGTSVGGKRSVLLAQGVGKAITDYRAPLMKALSIVGTLAMFLVGGGLSYTVLRRYTMPLNTFAQQQAFMAHATIRGLNLVLGFIIGAPLWWRLVKGV